ncbi:MAG: HesA/MoeB/ThiF family protein [Gammaproteobacteria bacterium]
MGESNIRYARQTSLPQLGAEGQETLGKSHALVIGLGGLGTPACLYLANSGVGLLTICDFDKVDETNLPRQVLYAPGDIGESKTRAAAAYLWARVPEAEIREREGRLSEPELRDLIAGVDVVLDCTDNFQSRTMINKVCAAAGKTLVTGAAIRFEGQLSVFDFSRAKRPCYSCLYSAEDENLEDCAGQGILAPVVGTIGCMMATEAIKSLLGLDTDLNGQVWVYDALAGSSRTIRISPRADCPVCA